MIEHSGFALTLWEPWASAIVFGPKRVENRIWAPPANVIGKRIWIHAGVRIDRERWAKVEALWPELRARSFVAGAEKKLAVARIIGSAIVAGYGHAKPGNAFIAPEDVVRGAATEAIFTDPWWMGPYGWLLADVRACEPVEVRGFQKLWRPPATIAEKLLARDRGVA